ncbi:hypothetical protein CesoFtcFv8_026506 [Champsocephalus esox]|uniref:WW domain binding protein 1 n=1 Tax=Champsocephalus esox TaxID=159716 RepID=A0AAN8AZ98_9TELE|nr:hypothetical protein CesoFtcFv8_026506 [Champsocephalus esox]
MEYHSSGSLPLLGRPRYCPGANANGGYLCETGHCCGETGCCTYYYELWWFWLLWTVLILFSCCCAYRHRRAKQRVQQQQRQREISLLAYHGANSYPSSMLDLSFLASLKLPSYEEVAAQPSTPPPPYSSVFTTPRYPQPPRTSDPHLLTQHDPLLHRPLSDGPSSLSSDNSSSCSCDSCCPSSPCSSSLSAAVTYETDTSHATTPSEAPPLMLDVTMETITAAASRLEIDETRILVSERMLGSVAVDIGDEVASGERQTVVDSPVPNQDVTVAVVTMAVSPLTSPCLEVVLPVGATSPIMQQLDLVPCTPTLSTSSTFPSPSEVQIISIDGPTDEHILTPKTTSLSGPSTPTASTSDHNPDPTRTFDTANVPSSPTSAPGSDVGMTLALISEASNLPSQDPNPSLVPIPAPSNLPQAKVPSTRAPEPVPTNLSPFTEPLPISLPQTPDPSPSNLNLVSNLQSKPTIVHDCESNPILKPVPASLTLANHTPDLTRTFDTATVPSSPTSVPASDVEMTLALKKDATKSPNPDLNPSLVPIPATSNLTQAPEPVPTNPNAFPDPMPTSLPKTPDSLPLIHTTNPNLRPNINIAPDCESKPQNLLLPTEAPKLAHFLIQEPSPGSPGSGLASVPPNPTSDKNPNHGSVAILVSCQDPAPESADVTAQSTEQDLITPLPSNVQAGFSSGSCTSVGSRTSPISVPAPVLTLTTPASSPSSCPAITIESSCTPVALSPSSPLSLSSTFLPAPALLLDPLTAMHQSNKSGSSSGHASSLSPSPRATQSPPKQTLFSPCVDIFEPGPPNWEDDEDDQETEDNDDEEDEDMGADESQYRHRRLTGDSGIEVCRCRVEDEDEEEEETKEDGIQEGGGERDKKGGGNGDLHDSVDCPARGQMTTGEGLVLCTSTDTPISEEGASEVVIVVESV